MNLKEESVIQGSVNSTNISVEYTEDKHIRFVFSPTLWQGGGMETSIEIWAVEPYDAVKHLTDLSNKIQTLANNIAQGHGL